MSGLTSRYPFTAAQWQELEQQALFFKFMVSGLPIPPDLIFSIKGRTSQPNHFGWSCFQLGLSQNSTDPEPTRCRRTDGKKWRCSRQTTGDAKYCERHMHRGKSRSRKHLADLTKPLKTFACKSSSSTTPIVEVEAQASSQQSASAGSGIQSNLSSVTSDVTHRQHHHYDLFNTKPVKDSNFMAFLGMEPPDKRGRIMYHQFIEESPQAEERRDDSWLNLNLNLNLVI